MTNAADATLQPETPPTSRVVDPIRIPPVLRRASSRAALSAGSTWRRLPLIGQVFVALSVLDVLWRAIGFAGMSLDLYFEVPTSLVTTFLPHNLLIALPALIVARRPDAAEATPLVLRGAILLALVELLFQPLVNSAYGPGASSFVGGQAITILAVLLKSIGWLALALGLAALTVVRPGPSVAGLGNLVFLALAVSALIQLGQLLLAPPNLGDAAWDAMQGLAIAMFSVEGVVFAYLARIVVRGSGDERRPALATALAATSMVAIAAIGALTVVFGIIALVQSAFAIPSGPAQTSIALGWVGSGLFTTLFLVAFGLGLADTSVRIPASASVEPDLEPEDDGPSWPEPGGEVPAFRPPEPDSKPKRRRSKRAT